MEVTRLQLVEGADAEQAQVYTDLFLQQFQYPDHPGSPPGGETAAQQAADPNLSLIHI